MSLIKELMGKSPAGVDIKRIEALLQDGADLTERFGTDGFTPLILAVMMGRKDVAGLLVRCGADPETPDYNNNTAITWAKILNRLDFVEELERFVDFRRDEAERRALEDGAAARAFSAAATRGFPTRRHVARPPAPDFGGQP